MPREKNGEKNDAISIPRYSFMDPMIRMVRCEQARRHVSHVELRKRLANGHITTRQFIATSHDLTPNGGLVRESPQKWP